MQVPEGLTTRALQLEDAGAVTAVMVAQELHDVGEAAIEEADIISDWQRPSFDVGDSTIGVFAGSMLIAYAEVSGGDRGDAAVHPEFRGRGIGTSLAQWMQDRARSRGETVIGMPVPAGTDSEALLRSLGYETRWTSWVLELPEGREIDEQPLPDGYTLRTANGEADHRAAWTVIEDAFLEWAVRDRRTFEDWSAGVAQRPGFQPWNLRLIVDRDHAVVAASYVFLAQGCGYIHQLAVRRDQRGLGLARALLVDSFATTRAHGATRAELSTDSRTGALGLYTNVGMQVTSTWHNMAIAL